MSKFNKNKRKNKKTTKGHAPFNFVSLPEKFIKVSKDSDPKFDKKGKVIGDGLSKFGKNSGDIELTITTKSPLFIGDSEKGAKNGEFFKVNEKYKIPGSSIRGMVRTLVEISSYSKPSFVNDSRFYFRDVAGKSKNSIKKKYEEIMKYKAEDGKFDSVSLPGILRCKDERNFYIVPTERKKEPYIESKAEKNTSLNKEEVKKLNEKYADEQKNMILEKKSDRFVVYVGKIGKILLDKGNIVDNRNKICYEFFYPKDESGAIYLDYNKDIKPYIYDSQQKFKRGEFLNLVSKVKEKRDDGKKVYPDGVPCFYKQYKDKIYFGHTPYFRIPYENSVLDLIPNELKGSEFDLTEAIFGKDAVLASRVYFDDADLQNKPVWYEKDGIEVVLSSPKPTSYNLYLDQKGADDVSKVNHYDSQNAKIRGYKLYHHKKLDIQNNTKNEKIKKRIKPLAENNTFKAKIRFESLSDIELGALLFVLNLPKNCYHKLGMAKPLGFGKVEIKARLKLDDLTKRYFTLFDENGKFYEPKLEENSKKFIKEFENFIFYRLGRKNAGSLWEVDRLKELEIMLKDEKSGDFSYMNLRTEFAHKDKILPPAKELV